MISTSSYTECLIYMLSHNNGNTCGMARECMLIWARPVTQSYGNGEQLNIFKKGDWTVCAQEYELDDALQRELA